MTAWKKRLDAFISDGPVGQYRYDDLAGILRRLGFALVGSSGSHRTWRRQWPSGNVLRITLVDSGSGPVLPVYVRKMRDLLRQSTDAMQEIAAYGRE